VTVHNTSTRLRALAALRRGLSFAASGRAAGVSAATVERWASAAGVVSVRRQRPLRLATLRAAVARAPSQRAAVLLAVAVAHRARATADHVELHAVWSALDATGIPAPLADARISDLVAAGLAERSCLDGARAVRLTPAGHSRARAVALEVRP